MSETRVCVCGHNYFSHDRLECLILTCVCREFNLDIEARAESPTKVEVNINKKNDGEIRSD